jgi:DNA-binding MarR family transcriptional regulator
MWDELDPRSDDSRDRDAVDPRHTDSLDPRDVFTQALDMPRGPDRERVHGHDRDYDLRGSEVRTLATIGAFRVVPIDDLGDERGAADLWHGDLDRLRSAGLIEVVAPLERDEGRTTLVTLTERGRDLLDSHQTRDRGRTQTFYAGALKSRELSHDAQLSRAYLRSAERLQAKGARVERIILDYELKSEYQRFLQERNRDRSDWAADHRLPVIDGQVHFPDFRIEYESPDGRRELEDVEVTTRHYRGAHASAKARSGFSRFRAGGGRVGGQSGRSGGRSSDPHLAEEFLE